jgi:hypothetical protein
MNMSSKFRTGNRSRLLNRYSTRMVGGAPRPRPPSVMAIAAQFSKEFSRIHDIMEGYDPLYNHAASDPKARADADRSYAEHFADLERIYGSTSPT